MSVQDPIPGEAAVRAGSSEPARPPQRSGGLRAALRASEFVVMAVATIAIVVTAAVSSTLNARHAGTLVTVLAAAYIISRGLAKFGHSRDLEDDL